MIQRIQSLYMFFAVLVAVAMYFLPVAGFGTEAGEALQFKLLQYEQFQEFGLSIQTLITPAIANGLTVLLLLVTIFLYKNRKIQRRMLMIIVVINLATLGSAFYVADQIENLALITSKADYKLGIYLPLLVLILLVLANNGIRKDEKLVKSADRLR